MIVTEEKKEQCRRWYNSGRNAAQKRWDRISPFYGKNALTSEFFFLCGYDIGKSKTSSEGFEEVFDRFIKELNQMRARQQSEAIANILNQRAGL